MSFPLLRLCFCSCSSDSSGFPWSHCGTEHDRLPPRLMNCSCLYNFTAPYMMRQLSSPSNCRYKVHFCQIPSLHHYCVYIHTDPSGFLCLRSPSTAPQQMEAVVALFLSVTFSIFSLCIHTLSLSPTHTVLHIVLQCCMFHVLHTCFSCLFGSSQGFFFCL